MPRGNQLGDLFQRLARVGGQFLSQQGSVVPEAESKTIEDWCNTLLTSAGEASGAVMADVILELWRGLDDDGRIAFLDMLGTRFGVEAKRLERAARFYLDTRDEIAAADLHRAAEPRRQDLFRRLNLAPGGVATLVGMRADLLARQTDDPARYAAIDIDFDHLFSSWFNRGFLALQRIDWNTPASILEKVIRYEAVHEIRSWDDLRRRLEPEDRYCYAFFHPQLPDEPLIFVEVALTTEMPSAIAPLLAEDRPPVPAESATHAVFYSISSCQEGLRGISFGNFLIKQVVEELRREMPGLTDFVTLSPVPGFARWLATASAPMAAEIEELRRLTAQAGWMEDPDLKDRLDEVLPIAAAHYFLDARDRHGRIVDPVARFHLGNGASLARINCFGDVSQKAIRSALGLMVNYRYDLADVERNHEQFVSGVEVAASSTVRALCNSRRAGFGNALHKLAGGAF